jgi:hypothetical protein
MDSASRTAFRFQLVRIYLEEIPTSQRRDTVHLLCRNAQLLRTKNSQRAIFLLSFSYRPLTSPPVPPDNATKNVSE